MIFFYVVLKSAFLMIIASEQKKDYTSVSFQDDHKITFCDRWSNTLKQFVGNSVFDHFVRLTFKRIKM